MGSGTQASLESKKQEKATALEEEIKVMPIEMATIQQAFDAADEHINSPWIRFKSYPDPPPKSNPERTMQGVSDI
jgi:hypothetical protein